MEQQDTPNSRLPLQLQVKYLLQALVVIAVTGMTILALTSLFPFELTGRYVRSSELYFLASIANLVFFHTLSYHIIEESLRRVLLGTAVTTLITSSLMFGVYYLYAAVQ